MSAQKHPPLSANSTSENLGIDTTLKGVRGEGGRFVLGKEDTTVLTPDDKQIIRCIPCLYATLLSENSDDLSRIDREKIAHFAETMIKKGGEARLDSRNLRKNYGTRIWPRLSALLVEAGLIRIGTSYWASAKDGKCKTYALPKDVLDCKRVEISCRWQPRRIARAKEQTETMTKMSSAQLYVCEAVMRLTVNPDWRNDSEVSPTGRKNLERIERKEFFCLPDKNGRLHHNLTNMARSARAHVRLDGKPLIGVDFSALHPNLILSLAADKAEKTKMSEWLQGDFYTRLASGEDRSKVKKEFNSAVNDRVSRETRYPAFAAFAREFPSTAQIVRNLKRNDHTNAALILQKLESRLIFAEVVAGLEKRGIACISLHDAIFAASEHSAQIAIEMTNAAKRSLGVTIAAR